MFLNFKLEGHGSHGNKGTILILGSVNVPMSVISTKFYFVEISVSTTKVVGALYWKLRIQIFSTEKTP